MTKLVGTLDKKTGWIIMETPILIVVNVFYFSGPYAYNPSNVAVFSAFVFHYIHRGVRLFPYQATLMFFLSSYLSTSYAKRWQENDDIHCYF